MNNKQDVTEQILFCQNGITNLNVSSKKNILTDVNHIKSIEETKSVDERLVVDILSNEYQYNTSSFELHTVQQCCIVSIISPRAFTIQLTRNLVECEEFYQNMNNYYNSIDDLQIPQEYLRKNLLCVTYDESIHCWNRSQIMEYDLYEDTVNVFFVDLNSWQENISRSRIRFILTKYSSQPVYILTCRLAAIDSLHNSSEWTDVVTKTFQNVIQHCQCDVEPLLKRCDNMFYVNLFAAHDEAYVCINDFLIHCQMAKPADDNINEVNSMIMFDDNGQPMHAMMALYWKAEVTISEPEVSIKKRDDDRQSNASTASSQTKYSSLIRVIFINEKDKIIFARYKSYIMLPWFTLSTILNEANEEKIKSLANKFGFKPVFIDPLSHPILCSQLVKSIFPISISTEINLYSIDCVRKILHVYHYQHMEILQVLDQARLAEASGDMTFWDKSYQIENMNRHE
ncbi:hypothetical protein I4U23_026798 [Adineta vaga]|nr:hypothetical protein I4U23_026798 [Adineta vaga]